jgi:hypothetical protein
VGSFHAKRHFSSKAAVVYSATIGCPSRQKRAPQAHDDP